MKNQIFLTVIILIVFISTIFPQLSFRSAVFLAHSSGGRLYDYDGYMGTNLATTSVPNEINIYNSIHNYSGAAMVSMDRIWFPSVSTGLGTDWYNWLMEFRQDVSGDDIYSYFENYEIIIIKGSITSTVMTGFGSSADTSGAGVTYMTLYNYKWIWRELVKIMQLHPNNFFVMMTGSASGDWNNTTLGAQLSDEFSTWAKSILATGLDPIVGNFPSNIYVFDYFHYLTDTEHYLKDVYESSPTDDHPNAIATDIIAPQFVQEVFNASIQYENEQLPVELSALSAMIIGSSVKLNWRTETEVNNYGFEVERSETQDPRNMEWVNIGFVNGNGNSNSPKNYAFEDNSLLPGKYSYRLKQIDNDGQFEYSKTIEVDFNSPKKFELTQNYPNPFNPVTTISWEIPIEGLVTLKIYDILGKEIYTVTDEYQQAGSYQRNFDGSSLSSGMYFFTLQSGSFIQTRKMILMK